LTLAALLDSVEAMLARAGISPARPEAEIIAGHALNLKRTGLYIEGGREVPREDERRVLELAGRRARRYPLQYITGECEFMSLAFGLREGVFIPRPETEVLVECVLELLAPEAARGRTRLLEVGTGSGVIAVSLACALAGRGGAFSALATDVSQVAVGTARANAAEHGVGKYMQFVVGDGISFLRRGDGRRGFDVFVCNPPYVRRSEIGGLEPEVRDHEPRAALDGGEDGLEFVRRIVPGLASVLSGGALVALEMAPDQGEAIGRLLAGAGAVRVDVIRDLSGRDRVITARMP
jgi:release factor glutamine methyltransferase